MKNEKCNYLAINDYMLSNENFDYRAYIILLDSGSREDLITNEENIFSDLYTRLSNIKKNKEKYIELMGIKHSEFNSMMNTFMENMIKDYKAEMIMVKNLGGIKKTFRFLNQSEVDDEETGAKTCAKYDKSIIKFLKLSNEELKTLFAVKKLSLEKDDSVLSLQELSKAIGMTSSKEDIKKVKTYLDNIEIFLNVE